MRTLWRMLHIKTLARRGDGASLVEYALLVSLIAVACLVALTYFQTETQDSLSQTASSIDNAGS